MSFRPLSQISAEERTVIADRVCDDSLLSFYWQAGIEDLARGIDNRLLWQDGACVVLGAQFGTVSVFALSGPLTRSCAEAITAIAGPIEVHVKQPFAIGAQSLLADRLGMAREMLILERMMVALPDSSGECVRLTSADSALATAFYEEVYPGAVFAPYMLDMPFVGVKEAGDLIACAGTLALGAKDTTALLGHFATRPTARGRGLAQCLGAALLRMLHERGVERVLLACNSDNPAALQVYRKLGFALRERWIEFDLTH